MSIIGFLAFALLAVASNANTSARLGINYGQLGNNLPPPSTAVHIIHNRLKASQVKIYDVNPKILAALSNTTLPVSVMIPNSLIPNISLSQSFSNQWVATNILPFYNSVRIRYLLVGNEILTNPDTGTWFNLVPAMIRIKKSLKKLKLTKIKVGTPHAMEVLQTTFPPSNGTFRSDIAETVITPMLKFLKSTKSFFFIDVYPYFTWASFSDQISLKYALLERTAQTYTDPGSGLTYTNLLDQMLDAVHFALNKLGYGDLRIFISETGWPNAGDIDQIGGNVFNAATYNRNAVAKLTAKPPVGTPARPGAVFHSFIFALFDENQKPGPGTERHFGAVRPDGVSVYYLDLSGGTAPSAYTDVLPEPTNNESFKGDLWCVVAKGVNDVAALGDALSFACSQGNGTCDAIQPGGKCYRPDSMTWHASYAFSSYWSQKRSVGGTCYFGGLAVQTKVNPSYGKCDFPSVKL